MNYRALTFSVLFMASSGGVGLSAYAQQPAQQDENKTLWELRGKVLFGDLTPQDRLSAIDFITKTADAGNSKAMVVLGDIFRSEAAGGKDLQKAKSYYEAADAKGNTEAAQRLGTMYLRQSTELGVNPAKALDYFKKGEAVGDSSALAGLGDIYREGIIVPQDLQQAKQYYSAALDKNNFYAGQRLGYLYLRYSADIGVNPADSIAIFEKGAQAGDAENILGLGDVYREGAAVPKDLKKAEGYYLEALDKGNKTAAHKLGTMYLRQSAELGTTPDKALDYFQQGADGGDSASLIGLGDVYRIGTIAPKDLNKAADLYKDALAKGNVSANARLGYLYYRNGSEIGAKPEDALNYFQNGLDAGDVGSVVGLGDVYRDGRIVVQDLLKAMSYYEQAVAKGNSEAALALGNLIYRSSTVLQVNRADALPLIQQAADAGNQSALTSLGNIYRDGQIVPKDLPKARSYLQKAYNLGDKAAAVPLARIMLLNRNKKAAFKFIDEAVDNKVPGISVVLGDTYLYGTYGRQNIRKTLSVLDEALRGGDIEAGLRLVQLGEQGMGVSLPKSKKRAQAALTRLESTLTSDQMHLEQAIFDAAFTTGKASYANLVSQVEGFKPEQKRAVANRLVGTNPNAFVYLLQSAIAKKNSSPIEVNGTLTSKAIRVIHDECVKVSTADVCRKGPLSDDVRPILVDIIARN